MFDIRDIAMPYPGLRPFEAHESEIFFGREGHTDRLLEILQRERFLAVIGPSGCGKSSLVRAGLLPGLASGALGTGSDWRLAVCRPGGQPLLALAQALLGRLAWGRELVGSERIPKDADDVTADVALVAAELRRGLDGLRSLSASAGARRPAAAQPCNLLVLVDQFEELFTYADALDEAGDESAAFVDLLLAARADPDLRVYVVITMRTDFLGHCVRFLKLPDAINRGQYLTPRLSDAEMFAAIGGPARVFGGEVRADLAEALVKSIGNDADQLPLLQHALARMWLEAERKNSHRPLIDADCLQAVGGVAEALNTHANALYEALPGEGQALTEVLFRAITERREAGGQDVRRPQSLAAIAGWAGVAPTDLLPIIACFAAPEVSFLQHGGELNQRSVIDLAHEALIRQWDRLQAWVENEYQRGQHYRRWTLRAAEWTDDGGLLTKGDLARALEWWNPTDSTSAPSEAESASARWQPTLNWAARYSAQQDAQLEAEFAHLREFIIASREFETRQREAETRRLEAEAEKERAHAAKQRELATAAKLSASNARKFAAVAVMVAVLAFGLAVAAYVFKQHAQSAEQKAVRGLYDDTITHASLLARFDDFAAAKAKLAGIRQYDTDMPPPRRHARDLLAGYLNILGGEAEFNYTDADGKPLPALAGNVAISPDGVWLAAGGERGTVALFERASGQLVQKLEGHEKTSGQAGVVVDIVFHPKQPWLISGGEDGRIMLWRLPQPGQPAEMLRQWSIGSSVNALALHPDGKLLASGHADGRIRLWQIDAIIVGAAEAKSSQAKEIQTWRVLTGHSALIAPRSLAFSPDGERLASAAYDDTAKVWDWRKGRELQTLRGHNGAVHGVAFSPDGQTLATSSADQTLMLWDLNSGQPTRRLKGHQNMVFGVRFLSADLLASASSDNSIHLWDVVSGVTRRVLQGHSAAVAGLAVHDESGQPWLYSASNDGTVKRWAAGLPGQWLVDLGNELASTAISPEGQTISVGYANGNLETYRLNDLSLVTKIEDADSGDINRLAYSSNGKMLASAGDNTAKLWQVKQTGEISLGQSMSGHHDRVYGIAFSPDGKRLATASYDGRIGLFALDGSASPPPFAAHEGQVSAVSFDPVGNYLISAGANDFQLKRWDLTVNPPTATTLATASDAILWASVSPDGLQIASVGRDYVVSIYPSQGQAEPLRLPGHEQTVLTAIFSPDSRQLATVGGDMTVRVWDLDTLSELLRLRLPDEWHTNPLWDFDFRCTPTGCWIAVPLTSGKLALYNLGRIDYQH